MTYIIILLVLVALELIYFKIADMCNIIDKPNLRSSHTSIVLRGGGILFPLAVVVWAAAFGWEYPWFIGALLAIAGISFVDDIHSVPNRFRIVIHFAAMLAMFYQWGIVGVDSWWMILLALIFCTGIINAYNFMDGINGITAGYSFAIIVPLLVLNQMYGFVEESLLVTVLLSILVFGFFNFRKRAKCFAGDVGSVGIAFIILFALGLLVLKTEDLSYVMLLAVYGVDSILTIVHRIMLKENIFEAHRKHAYQLMANELKMPHVAVSSIYMALQLAVSAGLIWLPVNKWIYSAIVLVVLICGYILFMKRYYHLHEEYLKSKSQC